MSLRLTATIDGGVQLDRELGIAATKLKDFRPPLQKIEGEVSKSYQTNFDTRGSLYGGWAARKRPASWPLLEKTGTLRKGYFSNIQGNDTLVVGNNVSYGIFHQRGTRSLPKRVILMLDEARKTFVVKAFQEYIVKSLRGQ